MTDLVIRFNDAATHQACSVCGGPACTGTGPHLLRAESRDVVCRKCGRKHAPSLTALLDLAGAAERAGRVGRHTIVPPFTTLLDLARAAENYSAAAPVGYRRAG